MNLPAFSLKKRVTMFMIYVAVAIFGFMSLVNLPIDLMPSIEIPVAIVSTNYNGAGSLEIENLVTRPVEQALATVSSIEDINSNSSEGSSMVIVSFADDVDMDVALVSMREKIDMISSFLPDGASKPMVMGIDPDAMPVVQFSISANTSLANLEKIANDTIVPKLERIAGVASVTTDGGYDNIVRIDTDTEKLRGLGLSIGQISSVLQTQNISLPSGQINYGDKELTVRTDGEFESIEDIKNTLIPLPTGGTVKLSEIAQVTLVPDEISSISKVNNKEVISISVSKQSGTNTSAISKEVVKEIENLSDEMQEIEFITLLDQSDFVDLALNSVMVNVVLGIFFSILVLFMFLKRFSPTLIIAISMPICIVATFLIMKGLNLTLNMMTLGGMAIGVGMIVDNSVVVLENIYRYYEEGKTKFEACLKGSKEVALSITASTITTIAVFLPVGLTGGMVGQMFNEFSLTITSLLIASLLIALTLVPLLCYLFIDKKFKKKKTEKVKKASKFNLFLISYQKLLKRVLKKPKTALFVSFLLLIAFSASTLFTGAELMPATDQSMIQISVKLPISSQINQATEYAEDITARVSDIEEVKNYYYTAKANSATIVLNLVSISERDRSVFEVADEVRESVSNVAGAQISVSDGGAMDMTAMTGSAISFSISGKDLDKLTEISNDLVKVIAEIDGATDVKSSASERVEQVNVRLKDDVAASYGLTTAMVSNEISSNLKGVTATKLRVEGDEIDVVVKGDENTKSSITALENMMVTTRMGNIPLDLVADVTVDLGPHTIVRENQTRTITISGNSSGVDAYKLSKEVKAIVDDYVLPEGYFIDIGGESAEMAETFSSLFYALVIAIFLVYFVLASQFESIILPFIVMLAMPLGLSGGMFGLFITNTPLSMPAFIGVIMLSGIVVNNSIVLIDYIRLREEEGEDRFDAVINACPLRVRPVLMTTLTTILGLIPMALGIGEGSEMMTPMAIVMIFGLIISTIITLIFTPVFYYFLKNLSFRNMFKRKKKNLVKTNE